MQDKSELVVYGRFVVFYISRIHCEDCIFNIGVVYCFYNIGAYGHALQT